jgi:hypothetical protein
VIIMLNLTCACEEAAVKSSIVQRLTLSTSFFASLQANFTMADRSRPPTIHRSAQRLARLRCKHCACLIRDVGSCTGNIYNDRQELRRKRIVVAAGARRSVRGGAGAGVYVCRSERLEGVLRSEPS